jgi:hypothetical protein
MSEFGFFKAYIHPSPSLPLDQPPRERGNKEKKKKGERFGLWSVLGARSCGSSFKGKNLNLFS